MKTFLVATITNVEMRILKTFMENSLKCLQSLGYFKKKYQNIKNYQNTLLERDNYLVLPNICEHSKSFI